MLSTGNARNALSRVRDLAHLRDVILALLSQDLVLLSAGRARPGVVPVLLWGADHVRSPRFNVSSLRHGRPRFEVAIATRTTRCVLLKSAMNVTKHLVAGGVLAPRETVTSADLVLVLPVVRRIRLTLICLLAQAEDLPAKAKIMRGFPVKVASQSLRSAAKRHRPKMNQVRIRKVVRVVVRVEGIKMRISFFVERPQSLTRLKRWAKSSWRWTKFARAWLSELQCCLMQWSI